jgi:hypothetical protein
MTTKSSDGKPVEENFKYLWLDFYAYAGQLFEALAQWVLGNQNGGDIRGSSCLPTSAALQIRHLP